MSLVGKLIMIDAGRRTTEDRTTLLFHHEERQRKIYSGQREQNGKRYEWPTRVDVPAWLSPGVNIVVRGYADMPNTVLVADGTLTVVQGGGYTWAIDTSIVVDSWQVAP